MRILSFILAGMVILLNLPYLFFFFRISSTADPTPGNFGIRLMLYSFFGLLFSSVIPAFLAFKPKYHGNRWLMGINFFIVLLIIFLLQPYKDL